MRERFGDALGRSRSGVRAAGGAVQDQARVVTPREAAAAGATYIVVGRMVTAAPDRAAGDGRRVEWLELAELRSSSVESEDQIARQPVPLT